MNVEGEVVDSHGSPVSGARVWISYRGHTNWGSEVAETGPTVSFTVRAVAADSYIGARAVGYTASNIRHLKAQAGSMARVRIVLGGPGAAVAGIVRNVARWEPAVASTRCPRSSCSRAAASCTRPCRSSRQGSIADQS